MNINHYILRTLYRFMVAASVCLSGCSWPNLPDGYLTYSSGANPDVPSSGVFLQAVSIVQEFVITEKNKEKRFISQTEFGPSGLSMVALTGFGQKLFELQYVNNKLRITKTPFMPRSLNPERIFFDMQMIYWPIETIRDVFLHSNVQPLQTSATPAQRTFESGDKRMIKIEYQPDISIGSNITYVDLQKNYSMTITTISKTPLDL